MGKKQSKVIALCAQDSDEALERLNRITGLRFAHWPESLAAQAQGCDGDEKMSAEDVVVAESISA
ncbi:hypothetical protein ACIGCM_13170 [Pseudomonas sp. NPDC078700]|uniref:hypothetical protein n=1 Tax=Pseudomonas sp. NPDC078700 TaxID=3364424 RepID=UPI0037C68415